MSLEPPGTHRASKFIHGEIQERNQLFQELIDFENFKTQKKVAKQKSALNALIGAGSSGYSDNDHDQILAEAEMKANQ